MRGREEKRREERRGEERRGEEKHPACHGRSTHDFGRRAFTVSVFFFFAMVSNGVDAM